MTPSPAAPAQSPTAEAPARPAGGYSLQLLLALLVLATALPMILLLAYAVNRETGSEVDKARQLVQSLVSVTAAEAATTLAELERTAAVLAERPQVRALDPGNCDPLSDELLRLDRNLGNVGTVNRDGQAICTVLKPANGVLPNIGNPPWFRQLKERGGFVVGAPQRGLYSGRWVVVTAYPLYDAALTATRPGPEAISGAVQLVVNLSAFQPLVGTAVPEGGVAGIVDTEGNLVARSYKPEQAFGTRMTNPELLGLLRAGRAATTTGPDSDGVERFFAFQPIGNSGWTAVVGLPTERIYAEARRNAWRAGVLALLVLVASALLVVQFHRRIAAPMLALRYAARRVASGQLETRAAVSGPREVAEVAASFNQMLERIPVMERELRQSEEHYRSLFNASPVALRVICEDRVVMVNPACVALFGVAGAAQMLGQPALDSVHPEFRARARERLRQVIEEHKTAPPDEGVVVRPDGSGVEVEAMSLPFEYQGRPAVVTIMHDLTARKAVERAIRRLNAELEESVQKRTAELRRAVTDLEAFSYTVAHDLRAPLRSITSFAGLLREQEHKLDDEGRNFLARIHASGETMDRLIDGLLALSRLGRAEVKVVDVDFSSLAAGVVRELREREGEAGARRQVEFEIQPGLHAWGDARLLKDVLENLFGNAWKFTSGHATARIEFGCVSIDGEMAYFVRDNGAGFESDYAGKLFGAFQRLHTRDQFPGTGIGLASVKRIIAHHGGRVWAEGRVEQGAVFYFTLNARPV